MGQKENIDALKQAGVLGKRIDLENGKPRIRKVVKPNPNALRDQSLALDKKKYIEERERIREVIG